MELRRQNSLNSYSKELVKKGLSSQEINQKLEVRKAKLNEDLSSDIEFVKSARRVNFVQSYLLETEIKSPRSRQHGLIYYKADAAYNKDQNFEDVTTVLECLLNGKKGNTYRGPLGHDSIYIYKEPLPYRDPYFLPYSWKKIRGCPSYMRWLRCHKVHNGMSPESCAEVLEQEPEMCAK